MFTEQQLRGGGKYSSGVLIGNWTEDVHLDSLRMKNYLETKSGSRVLTKQMRLEASLKPVSGRLLKSVSTSSYLSCDLDTSLATGSLNDVPCVRSALVVEGSFVYGSQVRFRLADRPLYLCSRPVSPLHFAKLSRRQTVFFSAETSDAALWQVLCADVKRRFASEGQAVGAGDVFVLRHVATGEFLSTSPNFVARSLLGAEFEVHAHCYFSTNKTHNLHSEKNGLITPDYALRRHDSENLWSLV
jgi:hypothetical protein